MRAQSMAYDWLAVIVLEQRFCSSSVQPKVYGSFRYLLSYTLSVLTENISKILFSWLCSFISRVNNDRLKSLFDPACLAGAVSWFAFVVAIFTTKDNQATTGARHAG